MDPVIISALVTIGTNLATGFGTWFLTRKKYNSEVDNNIIQNMQESLEFYQRLSDDNRRRLEYFIEQNERLEERDEALEEKNKTLELEVKQLRDQVMGLMGSICLNVTCPKRVLKKKKNKDETSE